MIIHRVIYRSTATRVLGDNELGRLAEQARIHNFSYGVTGVLFHAEGHFLQMLEGEPEAVAMLYGHIYHDPRHTSLKTLYDAPVAQRLSSGWSLGYGTVKLAAFNRLTDFLDARRQAALLPDAYNKKEFAPDLLRKFVADEHILIRR